MEVQVSEKGLCECGCGERTRVSVKTDRALGWLRGEPLRFVNGHQRRGVRSERRSRVDPNPAAVCLCGCGGAVVPFRSERYVVIHPRFLRGHQARKSGVDYVERDCGFETPCWVWQRKITRKGYGILGVVGGGEQHAHRWVYEREVGTIPDGFELHHRCENRACVCPAQLEPLTHEEHLRLHAAASRA